MEEDKLKEAYRVGVAVIIILAVLTIGEYMIGSVASEWWAVLVAIGLIKAYYVIRDYMHLPRLFAGEENQE